ncbi:MAG: NADH-quinone oxidoreductase subunit NuoF [Aggregatilineales bacterium]
MDVDSIIAQYAGRGREALLPVLWDVQTAHGYIGPQAVEAISHGLRIPAADIYGVISFYSLFHKEPTGERIVYLCCDPACALAGADAALEAARAAAVAVEATVLRAPCLGLCDHAPAALIAQRGAGQRLYGPVTEVERLFDAPVGDGVGLPPQPGGRRSLLGGEPAELALLKGAVEHRAQTLADYGDYSALRRALRDLTPEALIAEVEASGLIGRGGAAFPTSLKWRMTAQAPGQPHYVVCNADESEPGTFKDRALMESQPHLLLEGMALAGYAVGATQGYLFIRGEYPEAARHLQAAIDEARVAGLLGERVMGSGFSFHIELRRGAGAYICGEETALFSAIQGERGFPRMKPPYPTTHGLFYKPTAVNNVETLCAIPLIVERGAAWFSQYGTEGSRGTKLVSVSGHVRRPGIYEIAFGLTLRQLLEHHCGGVQGELQAVLMGGAAGTFLAPHEIDVRLTFEDLRAIGSTLGSGAIMVFNTSVDLRDILARLAHFFQHESCGKCFPCQLGTQRQLEILERLDQPLPGDRQRLIDVGRTMTEASLCGLGQTAASAVLSAIDRFPHLFEQAKP